MGEGITVECPHCSRKRTFTLGVGMAYSSVQNILSSAQPNHRKEIEEILKDHTVTGREHSHRLFVCDECYRLVDRLHVKLIYDSDISFRGAWMKRRLRSSKSAREEKPDYSI